MSGLSVIIPSRNAVNLEQCLPAVFLHDPNCEVILVWDDAGEDVSKIKTDRRVRTVLGIQPFCFSRNINLGIYAAGDNDAILCNDDAMLQTPIGFTAMQHAIEQHPEFGILSAAVIGPSNSPEHRPIDGKRIEPRETRGRFGDVPFVCVLIPRGTINLVGLLDERFEGVYGGEDTAYCYSVRAAGLKIGIYDGCVVDHGSLMSTFRPDGRGISLGPTIHRFRELYGFEMGSK